MTVVVNALDSSFLGKFFYVVLRRMYEHLDFKDTPPQFTKMEVVEHGVNKNVT